MQARRCLSSLFLLFVLFLCAAVSASAVTVSWEYNPASDTGEHHGFRIYWDTVSHASATQADNIGSPPPYANMEEEPNPDARTYDMGTLPDGTYYFRVATYGIDPQTGNPLQSVFNTPEVSITIDTSEPPPPPPPPSNPQVGGSQVMNFGTVVNPAAQGLDIPEGTNAVLFLWGYRRSSSGYGLQSATLAGAAPDQNFELAGTSERPAVGAVLWVEPPTGQQMLDIAWDGAPNMTPPTHVVFLTNVDPLGWIDIVGVQTGTGNSATVDSTAGDLVLRFDFSVTSLPPLETGWTSKQTSALSNFQARTSTADVPGDPSTTATKQSTANYYTFLAISLPGAEPSIPTEGLTAPTNVQVTQ